MGQRQNCWDFKGCGRETGGAKAVELGVCPATTNASFNGLNGGKNAGRICWSVSGTFCEGKVQGTFAEKQISCMVCDFFKKVETEEGHANFLIMKPGQVFQKKD